MDAHLETLLADQSGTVARQQLITLGAADYEIRRWLHRRDLVRLHPGVYVNHTGEPAWIQRAWGAVLATSAFDDSAQPSGSALARESALRLVEGPSTPERDRAPIEVAVRASRVTTPLRGVVMRRSRSFIGQTHHRSGILCERYEHALVDVASGCDRWGSFALIATSVGARRTTAPRVRDAIAQRQRVPQRRWLLEVLADVETGTCSVLERGFVHEVLRAHALPRPRQQAREVTALGVVYRDAVFGDVAVELDGRLFHDGAQRRDADLDRDLASSALGRRTVRLGWGQVYGRPCRTAGVLARVIAAKPQPCSSTCSITANS